MQRQRFVPMLSMPEIQNQRNDWIQRSITVFLGQLGTVFRTVIANDPERHGGIRLRLILQSDTGNADIVLRPTLRNVPLDLADLAVRLIRAARGLVLQFVRVDDLLTVEQQDVHDIRESIIIRFQDFLRNVLLRHNQPPFLRYRHSTRIPKKD